MIYLYIIQIVIVLIIGIYTMIKAIRIGDSEALGNTILYTIVGISPGAWLIFGLIVVFGGMFFFFHTVPTWICERFKDTVPSSLKP
jgi:hypothetical protein